MQEVEKVLGHEEVIRHLQNAVEKEQVSHSYIFAGEKGSGKKLLAKLFAMTLQCEEHKKEPCMHCSSCRKAMSRNHPDIIYVEHVKPTSIGIEEIREQLVSDVEIKPYTGPYKIYIVDEAEKMTIQAQNALLKTIEEPPAYAVILLLANNNTGLLPTITSRCVTLNFKPVRDEVIRKYLMEELHVPDYQADVCAQFAQGNLGKAIKLASSEEFNEMKSHMTSLMRRMEKMDVFGISQAVKELEEYKPKIGDYLDLMNIWFRDVLLYKATGDERKITFQDEKMIIKRQASECSYHGLNTIIQAENTARRRIACNGNYNLAVELMLLSIKENIA